jgi:integrase
MTEEIRVHVVDYGTGRNLMLRYRDPGTNKHVAKSAGTRNHKKAQQEAGKWQAELREGRYQKPSRMTWEAFRDYYRANALAALADSSAVTYEATLNVFERTCNPQKLSEVTTAKITAFATELRANGLREATVARHFRAMKVATRWARRQGLLSAVPKFAMPKRVKGAKVMRGRPITLEEFERMIEAVAAIVENAAAESWKFYLRGLWASGLRLSESLVLRWDDAPGAIVVDFTGRRPMLRIPCEAQKGNRDTLLPMTPEFATLLESVPERDRRGRVFKLLAADGTPLSATRRLAGPTVSAIGKKAGVVVDERTKGDKTVRKFASAHDLRRAFGQRWAAKVMPTVLRELMRHEDIGTTMKFYVGQNAEATADALWNAVGNGLGNSHQTTDTENAKTS